MEKEIPLLKLDVDPSLPVVGHTARNIPLMRKAFIYERADPSVHPPGHWDKKSGTKKSHFGHPWDEWGLMVFWMVRPPKGCQEQDKTKP